MQKRFILTILSLILISCLFFGCGGGGSSNNGGKPTPTSTPTPTPITTDPVVAAGTDYSYAVKSNGTVWVWGGGYAEIPLQQKQGISNITALSTGDKCLALRSDKTVWSWSDIYLDPIPAQVNGLSKITAIAAGKGHYLALDSDGALWVWGANDDGQLGDGTFTDRTTPQKVTGLPLPVIAIAAGSFHSMALLSDGTIWSWGKNYNGQLGYITYDNSPTLPPLPTLGPTCTPGGNIPPQPTPGPTTSFPDWSHNLPKQVLTLTGVIAIAAGTDHSLAVKNDGTIWAWGDNTRGELGNGTTNDGLINTPNQATYTPVQVLNLTDVKAVSGGNRFSLALTNTGTVYAWGYNNVKQLGCGNTPLSSSTPLQISELTGITQISAGATHSLAVNAAAEVWAWGFGHLGTTNNPGKVVW